MASADIAVGEKTASTTSSPPSTAHNAGVVSSYYLSKLDELELVIREKTQNLRRLEAQRNALNTKGR